MNKAALQTAAIIVFAVALAGFLLGMMF